jgi:hypothetical protein
MTITLHDVAHNEIVLEARIHHFEILLAEVGEQLRHAQGHRRTELLKDQRDLAALRARATDELSAWRSHRSCA